MKKSLISAITLLAAFSMTQTASAREFADIYVQCGLGAMIAPNTPAVAAVTNVTWDLGTTAILSNATSPETCKGGSAKTAAFIHDSYTPIENDLAKGQGEYLDTLMATTDCDASAHAEIASAVREDFATVVAQPGYAERSRFEKAESLFNIVHAKAGVCNTSNS